MIREYQKQKIKNNESKGKYIKLIPQGLSVNEIGTSINSASLAEAITERERRINGSSGESVGR